jgi:hypothetical protein
LLIKGTTIAIRPMNTTLFSGEAGGNPCLALDVDANRFFRARDRTFPADELIGLAFINLARFIGTCFSAVRAADKFLTRLSHPTIVRKHRSRHQTLSRKALESRDVSVETAAGPEEPEIRKTSPPG